MSSAESVDDSGSRSSPLVEDESIGAVVMTLPLFRLSASLSRDLLDDEALGVSLGGCSRRRQTSLSVSLLKSKGKPGVVYFNHACLSVVILLVLSQVVIFLFGCLHVF